MDSEKIKDTSLDRLGDFMTGSGPKPPTQGTRARAMPVTSPGKGTTSETSSQGSWVLKLVTLLALVCSLLPAAKGADISCQGIRYIYFNKGLDTSDIPRTPQQGIHLKICPRGVTCCTPEMESKMWTMSRETYTSAIGAATQHMQATFHSKAQLFDEFFTDLLTHSKRDFHFMFKKTYGILYERNSDVFTDFFKDLETYYESGNIDLEEALRKFFSHLYQRMFTVLNSQYTFDSRYLECVSKNMQKLQPFGDVPKKLTLQLRRSFVATRTFSQALSEGKKVLSRVLKIQAKDECAEALTKMSNCPACQGLPAIQPCTSYCLNVMKGCLAHHTELGESWDKFVDSLTAVGERLIGPFNIEAVVEPIDIKISDAIMNFQESGYEVTQKVFQDCGQPRLGRRQASNGGFGYSVPQQTNRQMRPTAGTNLDTLVTDIMVTVKDTKGFWTKLPSILCQNPDVGSGKEPVEQNCWNGRDRGYYSNKVVGDGLAAQESNPEVEVDISRPDVQINEQIFALKLVTNKLDAAYNGHTVEWPHYEPKSPNDSGYGMGSGDCYESDDEDCFGEGSSDGSGSQEGGVGGSPYDDDDSDSEDEGSGGWEAEVDEGPKWPPWTVTQVPPKDDVMLEENNNNGVNSRGEQTPRIATAGAWRIQQGLLIYLLPLFVSRIARLS